jgi:hypothetical protein
MKICHLFCIVCYSGEAIFNFTYDSPQNAYGKLESINYRNGQSLLLKYDYAMRINDIIQMPSGHKLKVNNANKSYVMNVHVILCISRLTFQNRNFSRILSMPTVYRLSSSMTMVY